MNIIELERKTQELTLAIAEEKKRHVEAEKKLALEHELLDKARYALMHSLDLASIQTAKKYIYTEGLKRRYDGEMPRALYDCIIDCSNGFKKIRNEYFGCKDYDRFSGQRCDCNYGYGPSHGHIVAEIGLRSTWRDKADSIEETDACAIVYYLNLLKESENRTGLLMDGE
jgi:hypothetical protein